MNFRRHCVAAVFGLAIGAAPTPSRAFDLEDYATTFRETRNALFQAANQVTGSLGIVGSIGTAGVEAGSEV